MIALAVIARRRQPTIIFVHTKELLYQWQQRIEQFLGVEAGLIGDGNFDAKPISVAIVNSARRKLDVLAPRFGHLVVDECHRVPASLFTEVVTAFASRYSLGLSATAFRSDGLTDLIHYYLGVHRHQVDPTKLYRSGAVLQPQFIQRHTSFHYGYRGNYQQLIKALVSSKRPQCSHRRGHCRGTGDGLRHHSGGKRPGCPLPAVIRLCCRQETLPPFS